MGRTGCASAPSRHAALETIKPLALPFEHGLHEGRAGGALRGGRDKRRRSDCQHGTDNRSGVNGLHAVAPPTTGDDGWADAFVNKVSKISLGEDAAPVFGSTWRICISLAMKRRGCDRSSYSHVAVEDVCSLRLCFFPVLLEVVRFFILDRPTLYTMRCCPLSAAACLHLLKKCNRMWPFVVPRVAQTGS